MNIDVKTIEDIINRGNTAEIKKRKDDVVIIEVKKEIKSHIIKG